MTRIARSAEEAEQEAWLRAELDRRVAVMPAMAHSIDENGRLVSVSDAWLAKLGYTRDEVLGRLSSDFLTPESRERAVREVIPEFFRRGRSDDVEYQMVCKDGRIIDVLLSGVLDDDPAADGRVSLAVMSDITALKQTKQRLTESEAKYRLLVESQSELVSLATPEGELHYVNAAYAALYGRTPHEMVGRSLFEVIPLDARPTVAAHLKAVCSVDHGIENENQVIRPDGQKRWISWTNRALTDAEGRVTHIHSVGRDIEERVVAEQRLQESEARYRFLADHSADLILLTGSDGRRYYASPACRTLLGYEPEEMLDIETRDAVHPDDVASVLGILASRAVHRLLSFRMRRKDGSYVWVEAVGRPVNMVGQVQRNLFIVRNIEQRVAAEQRLRESEARYRILADHATDMVFRLDRDLARRYVSPACREIVGYAPEEMLGINPVTMAHPEDAPRLALVFQTLLNGETERQSIINRTRHRDGQWVWVEAHLRTLKDPDTGAPSGIIGAMRDISIRKAIEDELADANRRLQALAGQDALTGLANRRAFDDALLREFRRAKRENKSLALIMIDVDGFKAFNDRYGHPAGDECLKRIGAAIKDALRRPGDIAVRYGGEEFAVLLPDTDESGAVLVAEGIREAVMAIAVRHEASMHHVVTVSAGVAAGTAAVFDGKAEALLEAADRALYRAKRDGRNAVADAAGTLCRPHTNVPTAA